jgi:Cu+-exporting ATPase
MHPEVISAKADACPICGMSLEPINISLEDRPDTEYTSMLKRLWVAGIVSSPLMLIAMLGSMVNIQYIESALAQMLLATITIFLCGSPIIKRGIDSIKSMNLNMFSLIIIGVLASYIYSIFAMAYIGNGADLYFESGAIIITLVLFGQVIELKARSATSSAIKELLKLSPNFGNVVIGDKEKKVLISKLKVGDILRVKPGETIPLDGIIIEGESHIDESMLTGESMPVAKTATDFVIGGTMNLDGSFLLRVTKVQSETILSEIVNIVMLAQRSKAPIQKIADKVSAYFVPSVIITSMVTAAAWYFLTTSNQIEHALMNSIAVLIIACPCAIGLATPMSIMVATGIAARSGVLIKNSQALEMLGKIDVLAIDKTGTLTKGNPSVVSIITINGFSKERLLQIAASIEISSEHQIAHGIIREAERLNISMLKTTKFKNHKGRGVESIIDKRTVLLGNDRFMSDNSVDISQFALDVEAIQKSGKTVIYVAFNGLLAGVISVGDQLKDDVAELISAINQLNIEVVMLTGDNENTAKYIAKKIGIKKYKSDLTPDEKQDYIKSLKASGKVVAMAGDGVNDAPSLVEADVGIAMGNGTQVAIESADITLLKGDISAIIRAFKISKNTVVNIKQNLFLAFLYNTLAIPIAAGVLYPSFGLLLSPIIASAAMSLSSVSVILNALRLKP